MVKVTPEVIKGFVGSCLIKRFDGAVPIPPLHEEWWKYCCSPNKFVAIAAPRNHSKSTAITLSYTLAKILFRESEYVVIVSDTESQASLFLGAIKQELLENKDIGELFGLAKDEKGNVKFKKDSETDVIIEFTDGHKVRIVSKGSEQKLRGFLWNGKRPDLLILDDLENDEIVMNKERREKFRRWFYGALLPIMSKTGILRYVGTILHMDSMLERLMPENQLISRRYIKHLVREELKEYSTHPLPWLSVKYWAHNEDFSKILWKERFPKEELQRIREDYVVQGLGDVYSQEYLNRPIDESIAYYKKNDFINLTEDDRKKKLNYYIGVDLAISEKEKADYTAIAIGGVDNNNNLQIRNVIRDRMDSREIVDLIINLQKIYEPVAIGIEEMQVSKSIGPFLREAMREQNIYPTIVPLKPYKQDKIMRARSFQARMRAGAVKWDKTQEWFPTLEDEMIKFPRSKHDDQVDATSYLGLLIDMYMAAPSQEEEKEEEYQMDLKRSKIKEQGRNHWTGY